MDQEKKYSAKEAAVAVLKKTEELLSKNKELNRSIQEQDRTGKQDVQTQPAPNKNPKEIEENGNPAPGAFPQNEEKYGAEMKGHIKLAKFLGRMEAKKSSKAASNG